MRSFQDVGSTGAGEPLLADSLIEFHAARLLLLLRRCGVKGRVEGLTKLAKLDFFVRYPAFFDRVRRSLTSNGATEAPDNDKTPDRHVESSMVRYRYGPWDDRYYQVIPYLQSRGLVAISPGKGRRIDLALTDQGSKLAKAIEEQTEQEQLVRQMREVKKLLGSRSGSALKKLIYTEFDKEVASRAFGEAIS